MRLPRGVAADRFVRRAANVRLRHEGPPAHTITVPLHNPLKAGTLHGILSEIARMRSITIESIADLL